MANITPFTVSAFFSILIGWVIIIVALSGTSWSKAGRSHFGLLKACSCGDNLCVCADILDHAPEWLKATLAALCLAFIANFVAVVTKTFIIINVGPLKTLRVVTIFFLLFAVLWNIIALIIFGVKADDAKMPDNVEVTLGWTYGMPILAVILELFGVLFTALSKAPETA